MTTTYSYGPGSYDPPRLDAEIQASTPALPGYQGLGATGAPTPPASGPATAVDTYWSADLTAGQKPQLAGVVAAHSGTSTRLPAQAFLRGTPGPRLTLIGGYPVPNGDAVGTVNAVYYEPYLGEQVPLYDGTAWTWVTFPGSVTLNLDAAAAHAGYH